METENGMKKKIKAIKPKKSETVENAPLKKTAPAPPITTVAKAMAPAEAKKLKGENAKFQKLLLNLRDHVIDQISGLAGDNLRRNPRESAGDLSGYSFHMADAGTDTFDREFALSLVSSEQEALYEIEEAIKRLELGSYGKCENCEKPIAKPRLEAVPFARMCVQCQSEQEKNTKRAHGSQPTFAEMADDGDEDEEE